MTATTPPVEQPKGLKSLHLLWRIFYVVLLVMTFSMVGFVTFRPILVLPRMTLSPGFAFTDETGAKLSNEDLRGQIVLYTFTHTRCGDACADDMALMAEMQSRIGQMETDGIPVQLVTISFDPEHDSPEVLADFAQVQGADPGIWSFVTGNPITLKSVIGGGFSTYYDQREDGSFVYDPAFMLVDGNGILLAKYRKLLPDADILERDINLLVEEAHNSQGVNKYAYEAAHLFLCYP